MIDMKPMRAEVIKYRSRLLLLPRCSIRISAELLQGVESCHYGPRFGSVVGLLGRAFRSRQVINRGGADGGVLGKYGLITSSHRAR